MGLESINLFNGAIRPLGFNRPLLAVTKYYAEEGFVRDLDHPKMYPPPFAGSQDRSVALVKRPCETTMSEGELRCDLR